MAKQVYVIYEKTNPFPGWIREQGKVDLGQTPDDSTMAEHLIRMSIRYPDTGLHLFPLDTAVDPEVQKFDEVTEELIDLELGDITPNAQTILDEAQKEQDIIDNLPSWAAIESELDSIRADGAAATTINQLKAALGRFLDLEEKHARITYWLAKNKKD